MRSAEATTRAEEAAANFIGSLGVDATPQDQAIMFHAYVVGWIQGASAGANEARLDTCSRRTFRRRSHVCDHHERG